MSSHVFQPTDIVLAKVKGFPAWPAMIIPEEIIPANVLKGKSTKTGPDNDEEDDDNSKYIVYSELLRFRKYDCLQSSYCVKFFCDDSYIWLKPTDFQPLSPDQCDAWLNSSKRKNKKLIPAYEMAKKGSEGIDIWEFVEYGSNGKPDEEEYVEEEVFDEEEAPEDAPDDEDENEEETSFTSDSEFEERPRNRTRRRTTAPTSKRPKRATAKRSTTRASSRRSTRTNEIEEEQEPREPPKKKSRQTPKKKKPQVERYKFEDDENWLIVGLGPQDPSIASTNSLVSKLSQKKNLEIHNEFKADLEEKLIFINKSIITTALSSNKKDNVDDYHILMDELDQCLSLKGSQDEMVTVFHADHELLLNLRVLLNLKHEKLETLGLWTRIQEWFANVYGEEFVPDETAWSATVPSKPVTSEPEGPAINGEEPSNGK